MMRAAAVFQIILVAATWPLWFGTQQFPSVPVFAALRGVPAMIDRGLGGVFVVAVSALVVQSLGQASKRTRVAIALAMFADLLLCCLNQHRLQPWNVLFLLIALSYLVVETGHRTVVVRVAVAMIYLCAALSRVGPQIDDGVSRQIPETVLSAIGLDRLNRFPALIFAACSAMSIVEFTAGALLLTRCFRIVGIALAMVIHATLLLTLSPLGLNHNAGVLVWNAFFLVLLPMLTRSGHSNVGGGANRAQANEEPVQAESRGSSRDAPSPQMSVRAKLLTTAVVVFPLSGLVGIADNWPSWQLYSPRPEVLAVYVRRDAIDELPQFVRPFVGEPAPLDDWHPVRIDRWSLAATGAPIYPEDRFQLAVAEWLSHRLNIPATIKAVLDAPQQPMWWRRRTTTLNNADEIRQAAEQHSL